MRTAQLILAGFIFVLGGAAWAADAISLAELAKPGRVLMLRHANAPGIGDPPNFKLEDCSTQRNLDAEGRRQAKQRLEAAVTRRETRAQAQALGRRLAQAGVREARVYSSQWCRCLETARLLNLGPVTSQPGLNSFFARSEQRDTKLAALRSFLAGLPTNGPPVILVTHQVTITAFTGEGVNSGGGSVFKLNGSGAPRLLGAIEPG